MIKTHEILDMLDLDRLTEELALKLNIQFKDGENITKKAVEDKILKQVEGLKTVKAASSYTAYDPDY